METCCLDPSRLDPFATDRQTARRCGFCGDPTCDVYHPDTLCYHVVRRRSQTAALARGSGVCSAAQGGNHLLE